MADPIEEEIRRRLEAEDRERQTLLGLLQSVPGRVRGLFEPGPLPETKPPAWAAGKSPQRARIGPVTPGARANTLRANAGALKPYGVMEQIKGARTLAPLEQEQFPGSQPNIEQLAGGLYNSPLGLLEGNLGSANQAIGLLGKNKEALRRTMGKALDVGEQFRTGASHLEAAPTELSRGRLVVSGRVPTSAPREAFPPGADPLTVGLDELKQAPEVWKQVVKDARRSPILTEQQRRMNPEGVVDAMVDTAAQNIAGVSAMMPKSWANRAQNWYPGGHEIINRAAKRWGVTGDQAAAVMATQSPGTAWPVNVDLFHRLGDWWQTFKTSDQALTRELADRHAFTTQRSGEAWIQTHGLTGAEADRYRAKKALEIQGVYDQVGMPWSAMDPETQARMVRAADELKDPNQNYNIWTPEGRMGPLALNDDGTPAKRGWQSYVNMANGLSSLGSSDPSVLSRALGSKHKVRSFFNNLNVPWDPRFSTVDVQHVAASNVMPIGQGHPLVEAVLAGGEHAGTGIAGAYPVYNEALKRSAATTGQRPSQGQSVAWEGLKALFSPEQKRDKQFMSQVERIWQEYRRGQANLEETHARIFDLAVSHGDTLARAKGQRRTGLIPPPWLGY